MKKMKLLVMNMIVFLGISGNYIFASATNEYAQKGAAWVLDGLFWIIVVAGVVAIARSAVKKDFTGAVVLTLITAVLAVLVRSHNHAERHHGKNQIFHRNITANDRKQIKNNIRSLALIYYQLNKGFAPTSAKPYPSFLECRKWKKEAL